MKISGCLLAPLHFTFIQILWLLKYFHFLILFKREVVLFVNLCCSSHFFIYIVYCVLAKIFAFLALEQKL